MVAGSRNLSVVDQRYVFSFIGFYAFFKLNVSPFLQVYAYRMLTKDGEQKTCIKVRGITLNSTTSKTLNFDTLKELVLEFLETGNRSDVHVVMNRIQRQSDRTIVTKCMRKRYRVVYDKRRVLADGSTLPFGY